MEPRKDEQSRPNAPEVRKTVLKPKLQIVKLEKRIAPGIRLQNHNEALVRDSPAKATPKAADPRKAKQKPKLRIVKLEERITPGNVFQHNETLVRDRA